MVIDGPKELIFMEFSNKFNVLGENFKEMVSKMPYSQGNPMKPISLQPSVTVAIFFATVTHSCKDLIFMKWIDF